jgi:hypothetical protein
MYVFVCVVSGQIENRPPRYFKDASITTPIASALKNYYARSFLEAPTDFFKPPHFWIQDPGGGLRSETAVS